MNVIYPNRIFREQGWLSIKDELGLEYLDCGGSRAFAITDHQLSHIYLTDQSPSFHKQVRECLEKIEGIERIIQREEMAEIGMDHKRSGDFILFAQENSWFAYYHWLDDKLAPDFARCIDVHRKYGYDPAELFVDPSISFPSLRVARKLIGKKLGFRTNMDLIPLDSSLVRGSHGIRPANEMDFPIVFGGQVKPSEDLLDPTKVMHHMLELFDA